jgi:hypothetical protein
MRSTDLSITGQTWQRLARGVSSLCLCASVAGSVLANSAAHAQPLPHPDHIVIVIEENKAYTQIIGDGDAPYINALARRGMLFTQSYGVSHPSQPNYLALFSGTTRGIASDACPLELSGDNLAGALFAKGLTFASYSESMPETGFEGCIHGGYRRKHNPVANWQELAAYNLTFSAFPQAFEKLPTVSFVVPDQLNDMHDGTIQAGDAWLARNIEAYARWAPEHNSLLIVTWDEDDGSAGNRIATIFVGAMVERGSSAQRITHYSILRTIEEMYGLPYLNESAGAKPIAGVWGAPGAK